MLGEFDIIERYFAPLAGEAGSFGLRNDAALVELAAGEQLVATLDTLVEGVHYLAADPPGLVARKLLRVNLSDLAAMGARPRGYLLSTALTAAQDESWLGAFAAGLAADQERYAVSLFGGDTVRTPGPVVLSLTGLGALAGTALTRTTARAGDLVYVSGTIGEAALGLLACRGELAELPAHHQTALEERYRLPQPRVELGPALVGLASACIDVSDGLLADLGHIARGSGLGAVLRAGDLPLSEATRAVLAKQPGRLETVLTGGDDYELLFTVAPERAGEVDGLAERLRLPLRAIGEMVAGEGVTVIDSAGRPLSIESAGWRHF